MVAAIGVIVAAIGVWLAYSQIKASHDTALGEFLLHIDERFDQHKKVHLMLRPGGAWEGDKGGPSTSEEWADIDAYMGLFERICVLIDKKMIDVHVVDRLYGYRISNIIDNPAICHAKLIDEAQDWQDFLKLCQMLGKDVNCSALN